MVANTSRMIRVVIVSMSTVLHIVRLVWRQGFKSNDGKMVRYGIVEDKYC